MYVDGQEMKTKLPFWGKGSSVTVDTEVQPNGKVRVTVQVEEKEVTFDWNLPFIEKYMNEHYADEQDHSRPNEKFYFAMVFANEEWKVGVE